MTSDIGSHILLPEPVLSFHPDRESDREIHPLRGLLRFGPYSGAFVPDPIRVATISPAGESQRLYKFMRQLNSKYKPIERNDYLPDWPGFHGVFGVHMRAAEGVHLELDAGLEDLLTTSETPHIALADRLVREIQGLEAQRSKFDVLFIYIPARWASCYFGGDGEDFDLHDHIKAATVCSRNAGTTRSRRQGSCVPLQGKCDVENWPCAIRQVWRNTLEAS